MSGILDWPYHLNDLSKPFAFITQILNRRSVFVEHYNISLGH